MINYCRDNTKLASHYVPNQSRGLFYLSGTFETHYYQGLPSVNRLKDFPNWRAPEIWMRPPQYKSRQWGYIDNRVHI